MTCDDEGDVITLSMYGSGLLMCHHMQANLYSMHIYALRTNYRCKTVNFTSLLEMFYACDYYTAYKYASIMDQPLV